MEGIFFILIGAALFTQSFYIIGLYAEGRTMGVLVGGLGVLGWCCRPRRGRQNSAIGLAAEVGLVLIAMLLMSGISWKAHFVAMLLPYVVLLAYLADARQVAARRSIGGLLIASVLLCTFSGDIITPTGANYAEAYGAIALGAVLAAMGLVLVRQNAGGGDLDAQAAAGNR